MKKSSVDRNKLDVHMDMRIMTVFDIYNMIKFQKLDINPAYARNFRWSEEQQTQLMLSILEGFPISNIVIHEYELGYYRVVDGVQRLNTIVNFLDDKNYLLYAKNKKILFSELSRVEQRKIQDFQLIVYVIRDRDTRVLQEIYKKINVSASEMTAQEKRNFLFYDSGIAFVKELAQMEAFKKIIKGKEIKKSKMQDEELVLRFLAFYYNGYQMYSGKMNEFLDDVLVNYEENVFREESTKKRFCEACYVVYRIWGDEAFVVTDENNRRKRLNVALFDVVLYSCAVFRKESLLAHSLQLKDALEELLKENMIFQRGILRNSNASRENVLARFEIWLKEVEFICGSEAWRNND